MMGKDVPSGGQTMLKIEISASSVQMVRQIASMEILGIEIEKIEESREFGVIKVEVKNTDSLSGNGDLTLIDCPDSVLPKPFT
jgi:hypothetical protein